MAPALAGGVVTTAPSGEPWVSSWTCVCESVGLLDTCEHRLLHACLYDCMYTGLSLHLNVCVCARMLLSGSLSNLTQDSQARRAGWGKTRLWSCKPRFACSDPRAPTQRGPGPSHSHTCVCAHRGPRPDRRPLPQAQVAALEQNHSPAGLEAAELQQEVERLRGAQVRTERALEARERAHRQRVRGLEEQVGGGSVSGG